MSDDLTLDNINHNKYQHIDVELLNHTPLSIMATAGRRCWDSYHRGGCYDKPTDNITEADREFLDRIINKNKHESVSEHVSYNFIITGISRAVLQELARHRIASLSVRSTRYTLGKDFKDQVFFKKTDFGYSEINTALLKEYFRIDDLDFDGVMSICYLIDSIQAELKKNTPFDKIKYLIPECYKTSLAWTINARSLRNFISLRTSRAALAEIRELAHAVYDAVPEQHKFLYTLSQ